MMTCIRLCFSFKLRPSTEVPELRAAFEERLALLEANLDAAPGGGPFLGGAAPCLADICNAPAGPHTTQVLSSPSAPFEG